MKIMLSGEQLSRFGVEGPSLNPIVHLTYSGTHKAVE